MLGSSIHQGLRNLSLASVTDLLMHRYIQFMSLQQSNAFSLSFHHCIFSFRCKRKMTIQNVSTTAKTLLTSKKNRQACLYGKVKVLYQGKGFLTEETL